MNSSAPKKNGRPSILGLVPDLSRAVTPNLEVPANAKSRYFSAEY